jgi:hypothetical protein
VRQLNRALSDVEQQPNGTYGRYVGHSAGRRLRLVPLDDSRSKTNVVYQTEPRSSSASTKSAALHLKSHAAFVRSPKVGFGDWTQEGLDDNVVEANPEISPESIVSIQQSLLVLVAPPTTAVTSTDSVLRSSRPIADYCKLENCLIPNIISLIIKTSRIFGILVVIKQNVKSSTRKFS